MKASEARKLANLISQSVNERLLDEIRLKIKNAATIGMTSVSIHGPRLSPQLTSILQQDGYIVKYTPDPDPGHPCSISYTEIYW